ncbi:MAG: hypothetical protein J3K34DRAFT_197628 [Monoraphidium minutum]|nr:MAG: hypothetical protein J3K34DRAFT_197628 [Monoraphidium minutum]
MTCSGLMTRAHAVSACVRLCMQASAVGAARSSDLACCAARRAGALCTPIRRGRAGSAPATHLPEERVGRPRGRRAAKAEARPRPLALQVLGQRGHARAARRPAGRGPHAAVEPQYRAARRGWPAGRARGRWRGLPQCSNPARRRRRRAGRACACRRPWRRRKRPPSPDRQSPRQSASWACRG